jgi:FKBP-type peptidyl-prolyl cis-trans isomerase FkpA
MKNLSLKQLAFLTIGSVALLTSCEKSDHPGYEKSESGLYYKFYSQDEKGIKPVEGDMVKVVMLYKNDKDSILFDTKDPKVNRSGDATIEFPLAKSSFKGSFEEALQMMSVGDSASFLVNADSVYSKTFMVKELPPYITKGSLLNFEVKLKKITAKDEVEKERQKQMEVQKAMMEQKKGEEAAVLAKYIGENKVTVKPTASGLYYIETQKGSGPKPTKGSMVKVNYTGRLLDGTVFDTSDKETAKKANVYDERRPYEPIEFAVGEGQVIPGWDEGIMLMSKGAKAKFIIPSAIAYGPQGGGPIPPYAPLEFDVELVSFGPPAPAPAAPNTGK